MKEELMKDLVDRFPDLFRDIGKSPQDSCMAFGCECGDGWEPILFSLCLFLDSVNKQEIRSRRLTPYAEYKGWHGSKSLREIRKGYCLFGANKGKRATPYSPVYLAQVKEKFGTLTVYLEGKITEEIRGALGMASLMSSVTCEECGSTKNVSSTTSGWIKVRCAECLDQDTPRISSRRPACLGI